MQKRNEPQLNELSATEAAHKIAAREITSEALVRACLDRIKQREPTVKAWHYLDPDLAIKQAKARDSDLTAARSNARGLLHGVPVGIKDIFATYDMPTGMGSPIHEGNKTLYDASCVALMRRAGAVIMGKTVTTEFAAVHPNKTTNPHNPAHTPGGSSSGSAAGVADYMIPIALGTQTAGSTIRPATFCGDVGYKPSYGLINRAGAMSESETLDTIGIITRTVEDAELGLAVLTARTPANLKQATPPRIGLCRTHLWRDTDPASVEAVEDAAGRLAQAGAKVTEAKLPDEVSKLSDSHWRVLAYEFARALAWEYDHHREKLSERLGGQLKQGLETPLAQYGADLQAAIVARQVFAKFIGDYDALLAPSAKGEAPAGLGLTGDYRWQGFWTFLHAPCITLPTHQGPNGLPVGTLLVGSMYGDDKLFAVARWAFERLGAWR